MPAKRPPPKPPANPPEHWKLPSSFAAQLARPVEVVVDELLPLTAKKDKVKKVKGKSKTKPSVPPFISALQATPDAHTWNGALGFSSTGEVLLDLFNDLSPNVTAETLFPLLEKAWDVSPEATLRIILHARSIHEGKGYKQGFFRCVAWLYTHHPRTLLANLHLIVEPTCERARSKKRDEAKAARKLAANQGVETLDDEGDVEMEEQPEYPPRPHGCFDDLNDILMLATNGQLTTDYTGPLSSIDEALAPSAPHENFKEARLAAKAGDEAQARNKRRAGFAAIGGADNKRRKHEKVHEDMKPADSLDLRFKLSRCGTKKMRVKVLKERVTVVLEDPKVQALYLTVIDIFASHLAQDLARLKAHMEFLNLPEAQRQAEGYGKAGTSPHLFGMSYAAKWAPTPGKSADKQLYVATALALRLFLGTDTKTARRRLQAEVLTPLRRVLAVPETKMVKGRWTIDYAKVPSRAMARYKESFMEHDPEGMERYLMDVASGKSTISGASMMPHMLLNDALFGGQIGGRVANLQWNALIDSIRSSSDKELANCIAVADVSGSMGTIFSELKSSQNVNPIWPCVSLTLLLSELARPPWNGAFITFDSKPTLEHIDPKLSLLERARKLSMSRWGMSTNYHIVFVRILNAAKRAKLAPEDMVKKIFVFSDMQFNQSHGMAYGATEHEKVVRMFQEAGYAVPEMVYWNLQAGVTKPVRADTPGVSLVSGFSGALMKYFIRELGEEEESAAEEEDSWDDLKEELGKLDDGTEKTQEGKKTKNPLEHMMAIIGANHFDGLVVVD